MRTILFASAAPLAVAAAFMSDVLETVIINGVRHNKSDVDADPDKYGAINKSATEKQEVPDRAGVVMPVDPSITVPPAPSAPNFSKTDENGKNISTPPVAPTIPSPNTLMVTKTGKKWFVVTPANEKVEDNDRIDKAGYDSETLAWDAIKALPR